MIALSGCGRQVTGLNLPSGAVVPAGQTLIRFETAGPLDFQNLRYLIVFNTTGNGQQPYAQGFNTDYKNWSAYFIVGGGSNFANNPGLFQIYQNPANGSAQAFNIGYPTGTVTFLPSIPNANAQYGFQIQFNRCLLDVPPPTSTQPPPNDLTRPCPRYQAIATNWNISLFTVDNTNSPVDSLGTSGPSDTSYTFAIETANVVNTNYFKPAGGGSPQSPSAKITGIEVFSTPKTGAVPAPSPTPTPH